MISPTEFKLTLCGGVFLNVGRRGFWTSLLEEGSNLEAGLLLGLPIPYRHIIVHPDVTSPNSSITQNSASIS